jgi:hypothetical protein
MDRGRRDGSKQRKQGNKEERERQAGGEEGSWERVEGDGRRG